MEMTEDEYLAHYGVLRKSGRYPWGSGETQSIRNRTFLDMVADLKKQGLSETEICKGFDIRDPVTGEVTEKFSTTTLRAAKTIAKNQQKQEQIHTAEKLRAKGLSHKAIGEKLGGLNESSVRALLAPGAKDKADRLTTTANMLKERVGDNNFIDVGKGTHHQIGVSDTMIKNAVAVLKEEGYAVHTVPIEQLGTGKKTNTKVLAPPGTDWIDVKRGQDRIEQINRYSEDGGRSILGIYPPKSIHPKRVDVRYHEDGGSEADGVIFVRPGVKDVSLGGASYAQVRISVGPKHYLKGMAMYKDDLPEGIDLQFNTNKSKHDPKIKSKLDAMKEVNTKLDGSVDQDNPYGANISRQLTRVDRNGNRKVTSVMNIVNEEGDWSKWSRSLSSQMLSKQNPSLAKQQLDLTHKQRLDEFERIKAMTNPTVRARLLREFGDETDSAAVHLKAAAIPRTHGHHVILPISSMSPNEVYAPNYRQGERVVLIRHPHGGTFEIPELRVNNNQPEAKRLLKDARDAIGIHHSVAERLSGADFDGDTVLVIPNNSGRVKTTAALKDLEGFNPRELYKEYPGMKRMDNQTKQNQMGTVSNLIADMTIRNASTSELARAIKHSMVVIDAEKHHLDYRQSAKDNGISQLMKKYQGSARGGASTLITKAGSKPKIPEIEERKARDGGPIDKATGKRVYVPTGKGYYNDKGEWVGATSKIKRLALTDDANTLLSEGTGTRIERIYADHSNRLKALANESRKISVNTPPSKYDPSAAKVYKPEVDSLVRKLKLAEEHAPLERQAQIIANATYKQLLQDNPEMDKERKKKVRFQSLQEARNRMGDPKVKIEITDKEWEAIQAGAVSPSRLNKILDQSNMETVRRLATPRPKRLMSTAKTRQAEALLANGFTRAEVADRLGVSLTTLDEAVKEGG